MSSQQAEGTGPSFNAEGLFIRFGDLLGPLVEEVGISREALTDPDVLVPLDKHCRLLELAARHHKDDFIGLKIGSQVAPRDRGPLGYIIRACRVEKFRQVPWRLCPGLRDGTPDRR
jgi:hypothetical protein